MLNLGVNLTRKVLFDKYLYVNVLEYVEMKITPSKGVICRQWIHSFQYTIDSSVLQETTITTHKPPCNYDAQEKGLKLDPSGIERNCISPSWNHITIQLLEPNLAASVRQDGRILLECFFVLVTKYGKLLCKFFRKLLCSLCSRFLFLFYFIFIQLISVVASAKFCQKEKD